MGKIEQISLFKISKILIFFKSALLLSDRFRGNILYRLGVFFGPNHYKRPVFMSIRNYKEILPSKVAWIFYFSSLWICLFGIFDAHLQGCDEVKNSMGLLQGPRLMAWTTKSPIVENHWVPWGCMAHLGSVNMMMHDKCFKKIILQMGEVCSIQSNFALRNG